MENIIDLIATDSSPLEISDSIKSAIFAKSYEKINSIRPEVANIIFNNQEEDN